MLQFINKFQRSFSSHVLLYHATFPELPKILKRGSHNVAPDVLYAQLSWMKKYFDCVWVDDLLANYTPGKFAVTFDDAYKCVLTEALPVLESLKLPATIFVNGITTTGAANWRDKVRWIINHNLTQPCVKFLTNRSEIFSSLTEDSFYKQSKSPQINSAAIDSALNDFLRGNAAELSDLLLCLGSLSDFKRHALLRYGNHGFRHYCIASLPTDQQKEEVMLCHEVLARSGVELSKVFSLPFGGESDYTDDFIDILKEAGYFGMLLSRNRVITSREKGRLKRKGAGFPLLDRYMPAEKFDLFQRQIAKYLVKSAVCQ